MSSLKFIGRLIFVVVIAIVNEKAGALLCYKCPDVLNPAYCTQTTVCDQDQLCFTYFAPYGSDPVFKFSLSCISKSICRTLETLHYGNDTRNICTQCCSTARCNDKLCQEYLPTTPRMITTAKPTTKQVTAVPHPRAPTITLPKQINVYLGSVQHITCDVSGYPKPVVTWYFNSTHQQLPSNTHVKMTDTGSQLTIANAKTSDAGHYMCFGHNSAGAAASDVLVSVIGAPPTIIQAPHSINIIYPIQKFSLYCRADGSPTPSIKWTYTLPNAYLSLATHYIQQSSGHGDGTLYSSIPGVYTCTATNRYGTAVSRVTVTEQHATPTSFYPYTDTPSTWRNTHAPYTTYNPMMSLYPHQFGATATPLYPYTGTPFITANPWTITHPPYILYHFPMMSLYPHHFVDFGGKITLHCNVTSPQYLPLHVTWRQVLGTFPNNVYQSGYDLVIVNAQPYNHRIYQCLAENRFGLASGILDVSIKETKPVLFESPVSKTIDEGSSVSFTCNGTGYPSPKFEWTWIDTTGYNYVHQLDLAYNRHISISADNTIFNIIDATVSLTGNLKCTVYNKVGHVTVGAQVTVIPLRGPQIKAPLHYFTTNYGTDITIACNTDGYPTPIIHWQFNEAQISSNNIIFHETSITIRAATLSNAGVYKCTANNKAGSDTANFTLSVIGRGPSFTSTPPSSVNVYYGHAHDFTCTANGIPTPKISWSFVSAYGGNTLPSGTRLNTDHTQISMPSLTDNGVITCIAENAYGTTTSQTSIYIKTAGLIG